MSVAGITSAALAYELEERRAETADTVPVSRSRGSRAGLDASRAAAPSGSRVRQQAPGTEQSALGGYTEILIRLIPTEIIGGYIALLSALAFQQPATCHSPYAGRWWLFGITTALTPVIVLLTYYGRSQRAGARFRIRLITFELVAAPVAFAAWASALPSTPFGSVCSWRPGFGTAAVIGTAILLPLLAPVFSPASRPATRGRSSG